MKTKRHRMAAMGLGCVLALAVALPLGTLLTGCSSVPTWGTQAELTENGVKLTLTKVDGADEYQIYHSASRYGTYALESTQTKRTYVGGDKYGYYRVDAMQDGKVISSELLSYDIETFGENMKIYAPTDDMTQIQADIDGACEATGQFSSERFSANFKAGKYNDLDLTMRYYMTFAGLGLKPTDAELGGFNVYAELSGGNATCNFWCGIENLTVNNDVQWAVSQATSFRRMQVNGDMALTEKGGDSPWGSGGFISDTVVTGTIDAGYQQQWLTRNSKWGEWVEGDMNLTYVGCDEDSVIPAVGINKLSTVTVEETPVSREKPFLVFTDAYYVCLPAMRENSKGVSWTDGNEEYELISLDEFYVARSDRDTAETLNQALKAGKHIFFTPGIYELDEPLLVQNKDTILMGNGLASLRPTDANTDTIMRISDVDGVKVSGLIFDAGTSTETLLEVGTNENSSISHGSDPIFFNDVYFRIGGAYDMSTSVECALRINANDVVGDNFWVWRADHGSGVGWNVNVTKNGVVVNGDNVTIYGLMVEHFHEYQTIWNGENGFVAFYQSETPYDAIQEEWMSVWNDVEYEGWASYKIADDVETHTAYGLGVYFVSYTETILDHGIEAPSNGGIHLEHMAIANFSSPTGSGLRHIINEYGKDVIRPYSSQKRQWSSFIAGVAIE